jgi:hypothetical protein
MAESNPNRYEPEPPPETGGLEELRAYIMRENYRIAALLNMLADGQIERTYAAPAKLNDGMIRFADGATWNPGSGRGIYRYDITSASWVFLG